MFTVLSVEKTGLGSLKIHYKSIELPFPYLDEPDAVSEEVFAEHSFSFDLSSSRDCTALSKVTGLSFNDWEASLHKNLLALHFSGRDQDWLVCCRIDTSCP